MRNQTKLWLIMSISAVGSLTLFIVLSFISSSVWNKGYDLNKLNAISQQTLDAIERLEPEPGGADVKPILDRIHLEQPSLRFEWVDSNGSVLYDTSGTSRSYDFKQITDRFLNMPRNLWTDGETISFAYPVDRGNASYYLFISLPSEAMKSGQFYFYVRTFEVLFTYALPLLISLLVPYLLSIWFFSSMNGRIRKLNDAMNKVNLRSDAIRLEDASKDEIGQLTRHYNSMAQRIRSQASEIQQFENRRKLLLSNLSHDLRTPLTMLLGYAETIRNGLYKNEDELQASAKIILQRSRYMDSLLDQLLDIARQDSDTLEFHLAPHNLSELLRKIVAEYMLFLDGQQMTIDVDIPDRDVEASIDSALFERAIRNLIDNAIRYGDEGGYLGIRLLEDENDIFIAIKDKGKGIPEEEGNRIFERFYRANGGRKGEGLGLGLSIVKQIVESHGGTVQVSSVPGKETMFVIRCPKKQAA